MNCVGAYGGAIYVNNNQVQASILNCDFSYNFGLFGGAIAVDSMVTLVAIDSVSISYSIAQVGGGIYLGSLNNNAIISSSDIANCNATFAGGGIYVGYFNDNIVMHDLAISDCATGLSSSSGGGGIFLDQNNDNAELKRVIVTMCTSRNGGGIMLHVDNKNCSLIGIHASFCNAIIGSAGGIFVGEGSDNIVIKDSEILYTVALAFGGGIGFFPNAGSNITLHEVSIEYCASLVGGGILISSDMSHILFQTVRISDCVAYRSAGGLGIGQRISHFEMITSTIERCLVLDARPAGGGLVIDSLSSHITFKEVTFSRNNAVFGGGVFSVSYNNYVSFAGCIFEYNSAQYGGGFSGYAMNGFLLIDVEGFENKIVFESDHPYSVPSHLIPTASRPMTILMNQTIFVEDAEEFVVLFDERTTMGNSESVLIYSSEEKTNLLLRVSLSFPAAIPGVDMPPIYVPGPSFYVEFISEDAYNEPVNTFGFLLNAYPVLPNPSKPCIFRGNVASNYGGGLRFIADINFPVIINAIFHGNFAGSSGGGAFFRNNVIGISMTYTNFTQNVAELDGGGLMLQSANDALVVRKSQFVRNVANGNGGGLSIYLNNGNDDGLLNFYNEIVLENCLLYGNIAGISGGGGFIGESNDVILRNCSFGDNKASADGGGLGVDIRNNLTAIENNFAGNIALGSGGGVSTSSDNILTFSESLTMANNMASSLGGALKIQNYSDVSFFGSATFNENEAVFGGGAISCQNSLLWNSDANTTMVMQGNKASRGSSILFMSVISDLTRALKNIVFSQNSALVGGTVFWLKDDYMLTAPAGLSSATLVWEDNIAGYGNRSATQPIKVRGPSSYAAMTYNEAMYPPLSYTLIDHYNQTVHNESGDSMHVSMFNSNCGDDHALLSGEDTLAEGIHIKLGTGTFSNLEAYCTPLGNLTIEVIAEMVLFGYLDYSISAFTDVIFRSCFIGEELVNGNCVECPVGSFSVVSDGKCQECISHNGIETCFGNNVTVKKGFWRRYESSSEVLECIERDSCAGGNAIGDKLCSAGYEGPLCSVCQDNYYSSHGTCKECTPVSIFKGITLIIYIVAFAVFIGAIVYTIYSRNRAEIHMKEMNVIDEEDCETPPAEKSLRKQLRGVLEDDNDDNIDEENGALQMTKVHIDSSKVFTKEKLIDEKNIDETDKKENHTQESSKLLSDEDDQAISSRNSDVSVLRLTWLWLKMNYLSLTVKLKITIATYQVVNSTSSTLAVLLPFNFTNFMSALDFMNIDLGNALPWNCAHNMDYIDFLIFTTLLPVFLTVLIVLVYFMELQWRKFQSLHSEGTESKYLLAFLWLTYLILPFVTTTLFSMFLCTNVDPADEDVAESDTYLTIDMTISCKSDRYEFGYMYACFMIIIYPFGILFYYAYLLYSCKSDIMHRDDDGKDVENHKGNAVVPSEDDKYVNPENFSNLVFENTTAKAISPQATRLAFLWVAYKPEFWYFEIIETSRRMMMTAVLSVISPGSSSQLVLAILLSVLYTKLYESISPYAENFDNATANLGLRQIAVTFFTALIVAESLLPQYLDILVDIVLVAANIMVACASLYYTVKECQDDISFFSRVGVSDVEVNANNNVSDEKVIDTQKRQTQFSRRTSSVGMGSTTVIEFQTAIKRHQSMRTAITPDPST